ncbi:hypothetical protein M9H77_24313 [Catharanthus roseus]|uniref:Uncharacterized protein n=1 Tax=Catharanthus roseus TaxID=4058 RepID=A0ACC0AVU0_CATRO|nr:hypothetical protein M9H77_24313 [Catharanthus roseus]
MPPAGNPNIMRDPRSTELNSSRGSRISSREIRLPAPTRTSESCSHFRVHKRTHEPETNEESDIPTSVPKTNVHELKNSNDDEDHPEAQAQALRDYQLSRDRARRDPTGGGRVYPIACSRVFVFKANLSRSLPQTVDAGPTIGNYEQFEGFPSSSKPSFLFFMFFSMNGSIPLAKISS